MPRVLACIDPQPLSDGTCQQTAWIEQSSLADYLPTIAWANEVGSAFAFSLMVVAFVKRSMKPQQGRP